MSGSAELSGADENYLLSALPDEEYKHLIPCLEPVTFALGQVVYDSGGHLDYIYFPTTSAVALLYTMEDGTTAEMGLSADDGVLGIALLLGGATTQKRAVVR